LSAKYYQIDVIELKYVIEWKDKRCEIFYN